MCFCYTFTMKTYYKQNSYVKMPWGKYKGRYLKEIPDEYIRWAILKYQDQAMAQMFADEWARRHPEYR